MNIPVETKPAFWGFAAGAAAMAIAGFSWGGWVTVAGAKSASDQVSAVAKACALLLVPA